METEVICLSSDSEEDSLKENKKKECATSSIETKATFSVKKVEIIRNNDNEKTGKISLKRKVFEINENKETYNTEKKQKLSINKKIPMVIIKPVSELFPIAISNNKRTASPLECDKDEDNKKPKLIVKEIKRISYVGHDIFPLFISLCLQKCPLNEKEDMGKIIDKLKRRYEQLDPTYASSEYFALFLNEKRQAIVRDDNRKIYVYIQEVMNEMKRSIKKKSQASEVTRSYDAVPSTSYVTNNELASDETELDYEDNEERNPAMNKKIKLVLKAMAKCEARIKELEEAEIDFDEESDSTYIKLERYKERMVDLYAKLCELTGEHADAGRVYLRPKHLSPTGIGAVDQAITNFINSKIIQRNQNKKKYKTGADKVIFPDCKDILECINHCNETRNLGLDKKNVEKIAKKAFKEIGEHLQVIRQKDYWDTFSLYLENTEDPAIKNMELAKKLSENRIEGEKKLSAVFEKYSKKQEEIKEEMNQDEDSIASDEEEESVVDGEDDLKDDLSVVSSDLDDSGNEDVETDKKIRIGLEENSANANEDVNKNIPSDIVTTLQDVDQDVSNKVTVNMLQKDISKKLKIISVEESDILVSRVGDKTTIIKKVPDSCTRAAVKNTQEVPLTTVSAIDRTNNTKTEEDPNCARQPCEVIKDTIILEKDVMINDNKLVTKRNVKEDTTRSTAEVEEKTIITKESETVTLVTDVASENVPSNQQAEEEKTPLLRVRSFAKPPTTWEDNARQKTDKTVERSASKVEKKTEEIIDLTNETPPIKSVVSKCTIKVPKCTIQGNKVLPVFKKTQTVIIPAGSKNIINVQNITNNYLKLNSRTGQIITPVRDIQSIIVPSVQTSSLQNQPQNSNAGIIRRYRVIQPKPVSTEKKTIAQPTAEQTDVRSAIKKSK